MEEHNKPKMHKKVYVYSGGCSSSQVGGQRLVNYFRMNGYESVTDPRAADLIVLNTCAFDKTSEDSSIERIKKFKEINPRAQMVVGGCLPGINGERMGTVHNGVYFSPVDLRSGHNSLDELVKPEIIPIFRVKRPILVEKRRDWTMVERFPAFDCHEARDGLAALPSGYDENAATIEIAEGCLGNCSYCGIKKARGKLKSAPLEEVISSFKEGLEMGIRSFRIWADDIGAYGQDIGTDLSILMSELLKCKGDYVLEVLASNPPRFVELYDKLLPSLQDKRIESFTVSVQSGSKDVLRRMNRPIDLDKLIHCFRDLREKAPHLDIRTHYMVGFPGESWEEFYSTIEFMKKTKIFKGHVLKFDAKPNTEAKEMAGQIDDSIKEIRERILNDLIEYGSKVYSDGKTY